jgi:hypothetical protein
MIPLARSLSRRIRHYGMALPNWARHNLSNTWGILNVFDLVWLRPTPGGLLSDDHPFVTGISPATGKPVWDDNLVYATPSQSETPDSEILHSVMKFLANMVQRSSAAERHPIGVPSRMPPAINYIHGCVHYTGASMLLNDIPEAVAHVTDPRFVRELKRLVRVERREVTIIFRHRDYQPEQLALFSCLMKTVLPWFGNPNGNRARIHWGVPSPYPAFNLIGGNWIRDTRMLLREDGRRDVARAPISRGEWFRAGPYSTGWSEFLLPERLLCAYTSWRVGIRGEQGGIYFVDALKLRRGWRFDPARLPTLRSRLKEKWLGR